mmetsp:Transcript_600/g.1129  ORF Transcript_600/g.1129 Transcript_600/m.1129 type:complete len:322 (+) Transcript_600:2249-3214(+)
MLELNAFFKVKRFLLLEGGLVKLLLELLVAKVDAKLLKRVVVKDLKAKDIEDTDHLASRSLEGFVDLGHQPRKQARVNTHSKSISTITSLRGGQRDHGGLLADANRAVREHLLQLASIDGEQTRDLLHNVAVGHGRAGYSICELLLVKLYVTEAQDTSGKREYSLNLLLRELEQLHRVANSSMLFDIVNVLGIEGATLVKVVVVFRAVKAKVRHSGTVLGELVKDVKVSLFAVCLLAYNTTLFQEIVLDASTSDGLLHIIKMDFNPLAETRRVVVSDRLGVTKGFKKRVAHQDLLFQVVRRTCYGGQVVEDLLCAHSFTGT